MDNKTVIPSVISIENRNSLKLTGVEKLFYSVQNETLVQTSYGKLLITGSNLTVKRIAIDQNLLELEGKINGLKYLSGDKTKPGGLFGLIKRG